MLLEPSCKIISAIICCWRHADAGAVMLLEPWSCYTSGIICFWSHAAVGMGPVVEVTAVGGIGPVVGTGLLI